MRKRIYIGLFIAAIALASCNHYENPDNSGSISLSASVSNLGVQVKGTDEIALKSNDTDVAEAVAFSNISSSTPLDSKLLFSFNRATYPTAVPDNDESYIPCHTNVSFVNKDLTFVTYKASAGAKPENLKYPSLSDETVYCVGLYPFKVGDAEGWNISNDGTSASHNVDGCTDIMFAEEISGTWNSPFPAQTYSHVQTWVKVLVSATTNDAAEKWGKITRVTVKSMDNVNVSFSDNISNSVNFTGSEQDIILYNNAAGDSLSITTEQLGSVFIAPPLYRASASEQTLVIKVHVYTTTFTDGKEVNVKLYDLNNDPITDPDYLIGKLFVLNLNFTPLSVIEGVCTLNYWNAIDEDLYLDKE